MKALVLSGGASKGAFTAGVVRYLLQERHMDFDCAVGNSTGSLVGGPALLGEYNYLSNVYVSVRDTDIFKNSFIGNLTNFLGIQDGPIDASMEPLHEILKEYYLTRGKLQELLDKDKLFSVATINVYSGKIHFISTRHVAENKIKPETFVKAILASCCEPVFTEPVQVYEDEDSSEFKDDLFYDGGVKEFIPLEHAVILGASEIWAVSTHTLKNEETEWGRDTNPDSVNILKALGWTISSILDEVARGDRFRADFYVKVDRVKKDFINKLQGFGLTQDQIDQLMGSFQDLTPSGRSLPELRIIRPSKPMHTSLSFDPAIMFTYLVDGERDAEKFIDAGAPLYTDDTIAPWNHEEHIP